MRTLLALVCLLSVASATTYYVAKTGEDDSAGTASAPWLTINHAAGVVIAGDSVLVAAGTYAELVDFNGTAGTAAAPVVFRSSAGLSTIIGGVVYFNAEHYRLEAFKVLYDSTMAGQGVKFDADSCQLNDCEVVPPVTPPAYSTGVLTGGGPLRGVVIHGNTVHGFGSGGHGHGIYASGIHLTVTNNTVYDNEKQGIQVYPELESSEVAYNVSYDNRGSNGIILLGFDNSVHHNISYGNNEAGIHVYNPQEGSSNAIFNNVFYDNYFGISIADGSLGSDTVRNNISHNNGAYQLYVGPGATVVLDYNCYWPDTNQWGNEAFSWNVSTGSFAEYQAATGQDAHGMLADPLFVDTTGPVYDFHLTVGSPCIDAGDPATTAHFDFDGNWVDGDYDIGAYEYGGSPTVQDTMRVVQKLMRMGW